jgi:hypothetical protein
VRRPRGAVKREGDLAHHEGAHQHDGDGPEGRVHLHDHALVAGEELRHVGDAKLIDGVERAGQVPREGDAAFDGAVHAVIIPGREVHDEVPPARVARGVVGAAEQRGGVVGLALDGEGAAFVDGALVFEAPVGGAHHRGGVGVDAVDAVAELAGEEIVEARKARLGHDGLVPGHAVGAAVHREHGLEELRRDVGLGEAADESGEALPREHSEDLHGGAGRHGLHQHP